MNLFKRNPKEELNFYSNEYIKGIGKSIGKNKYFHNEFLDIFRSSYKSTSSPVTRIIYELIRITLGSFLCFIVIQFFLKDLFLSAGVTGLSLIFFSFFSFVLTISSHNQQYILYGLFLIFNIPFLLYGWKRLETKTLCYSIYYVAFITICGIFLGTVLTEKQIVFRFAINFRNELNELIRSGDSGSNFIQKSLISFLLAIIGGILYGIGISIIYSSRGTTAGTDTISIYWSIVLKKNIGLVNFIVNSTIVIFGTIFLYFFDPLKKNLNYSFLQYITSYKILGTVTSIFVYSFVIDKIFPRNVKVLVHIFTNKDKQIINTLSIKNEYLHSFTILDGIGSYKNRKFKVLLGTMTEFEYYRLKKVIKEIDPDTFMVATPVKYLSGFFIVNKSL